MKKLALLQQCSQRQLAISASLALLHELPLVALLEKQTSCRSSEEQLVPSALLPAPVQQKGVSQVRPVEGGDEALPLESEGLGQGQKLAAALKMLSDASSLL
jgi:hypothetical protein